MARKTLSVSEETYEKLRILQNSVADKDGIKLSLGQIVSYLVLPFFVKDGLKGSVLIGEEGALNPINFNSDQLGEKN